MKKTAYILSLLLAMTSFNACNKDNNGTNTDAKTDAKTESTDTEKENTDLDIEDGDPCDPAVDSTVCSNGVLYTCEEVDEVFCMLIMYYGGSEEDCAPTWYGEECSDNTTCQISASSGEGQCVTACNEGEGSKSVCSADSYDEDITIKTSCEKAKDGKFYEFISDAYYCNHGCNTDKTDCVKNNEEEYKDCDESYLEKCDANNNVVYCADGKVAAISCGSQACNVKANENWADCTIPCTEDQIGQTVNNCYTKAKEKYGVELQEQYTCMAVKGENKSAAFYEGEDYDLFCSSCSNENVACVIDDADAGYNAKAGDNCNSMLFRQHCGEDGKVYFCDAKDKNATSYIVYAKGCEENQTCVSLDKEYEQMIGSCIDMNSFTEKDKCSAGSADTNSCYTEDGYIYSMNYSCFGMTWHTSVVAGGIDARTDANSDADTDTDTSKSENYLMLIGYEYCENGCDNNTGLCK